MNRTAWLRASLVAAGVFAIASAQAAGDPPLEATTDDGRKVFLYPDGRWEFESAQGGSASASGQPAPAQVAQPAGAATAAQPDDRYCQGGLFGVGRRICPGDPDYNRGSLNPKLR
jgi:hypothetical protein